MLLLLSHCCTYLGIQTDNLGFQAWNLHNIFRCVARIHTSSNKEDSFSMYLKLNRILKGLLHEDHNATSSHMSKIFLNFTVLVTSRNSLFFCRVLWNAIKCRKLSRSFLSSVHLLHIQYDAWNSTMCLAKGWEYIFLIQLALESSVWYQNSSVVFQWDAGSS